ncbi:MAG: hypothetical protein M1840_003461 [Geoglossum simile]|nr:MAG: hypothetical protein M1840_003461 [Geoglossum simile]
MSDHAINKAPNATYTENPGYGTRPTGFGKFKAFARKYWWLLLIGFLSSNLIIILCLLVYPPLSCLYLCMEYGRNLSFLAVARSNLGMGLTSGRVYVGLPNIAQQQVDKSTLEIKSMVVTNPTSHSVQIQQEAFLHSSSIFTPTLDAFPAALFLESTEPNIKPFAYLQLPKVRSTKSTLVSIDQTVKITDIDQFSEYTKTVMNSETFRVALRGRTVLHLGRLPATSVNYNEVLTFKGLNKLKGFDILGSHIVLSNDTTAPNLIGHAYIPNPSLMTLQMGNVTYDLYANNTFIGQSLIPNLTLRPGNNTVEMRSKVNLLLVAKLTNATAGMLELEVRGNSSVYNGQHLPYFEAAIKSNPIQITLNATKAKGG